MKSIIIFALFALAAAEESDRTLETAINFVKDCKGDYILCVKVVIFSESEVFL